MARIPPRRRASTTSRVPRTYRLTVAKLQAAKRALGVATATDAIEQALDLVLSRFEDAQGTASASKPWMAFAGTLEGRPQDSESVDEIVYGRPRP